MEKRCFVKCVIFSMTLFALDLPVFAKEFKCQYELYDGKIKVFDYLLEPKNPIDDTEDTVIACDSSPDGRWITVQSGYRISVDIWLYDSYTKKRPIRIDTQPGNHTRVNFHSNAVFEVRWGGMGYRMSDFFQVDKPKVKVHIDDVLSYFDVLDAYVSFYENGVVIGKVFEKIMPEKFHIDFDLTKDPNAISPLFVIDKIKIIGEELIVSHRRTNGQMTTEVFKPKLLKGNTAQLESNIE